MRPVQYRGSVLAGVLIVVLVAVLSACDRAPELAVDESYSGKEVRVSAGGSIKVTLESNPTTGFKWELARISDAAVLEKVSNRFGGGSSSLIGAGGEETWRFKALRKGRSTLSMEYSQPWEKGMKGLRKFDLVVVVE